MQNFTYLCITSSPKPLVKELKIERKKEDNFVSKMTIFQVKKK